MDAFDEIVAPIADDMPSMTTLSDGSEAIIGRPADLVERVPLPILETIAGLTTADPRTDFVIVLDDTEVAVLVAPHHADESDRAGQLVKLARSLKPEAPALLVFRGEDES